MSLLACAGPTAAQEPGRVIDGFESAAPWTVIASDGVKLELSIEPGRTGQCARLDYDFTRGSGYAIIRRDIDLPLPPNYRFSYAIRGEGPSNTFEFKLVDPTGDNVWWVNSRNVAFPRDWQAVSVPRRKISFAWGPSAGAPLLKAQHLELVITSYNGGRGTVWLDDLRFEPLPDTVPYTGTPTVTVIGSQSPPRPLADDGSIQDSELVAEAPAEFLIDFARVRELGGVALDWGDDAPSDYTVSGSLDGVAFSELGRIRGGNGGRDYLTLADAAARQLKITTAGPGPKPVALRGLRFLPPAFADSDNRLLELAAADAPRGWYPRYFRQEATYWTVIGTPGDEKEALINEEGAVEVDKLGFSLEPFVSIGGRLLTWNESANSQSLLDDALPIPSVRRSMSGLDLGITAFATGEAGRSVLNIRYTLTNTGTMTTDGTLHIAARPMQVNPQYQNLNITGGAARTHAIRIESDRIRVDDRSIFPTPMPAVFGATPFDGGEIVEHLSRGVLPAGTSVIDPRGLASAGLSYPFELDPDGSMTVAMQIPFHDQADAVKLSASGTARDPLAQRLAEAREAWHGILDRVPIRLPSGNERITESIRANLAYILINRDGPGIQPGSRSYERTWIRDGALTSTALLSMGLSEYATEFLDWFAPYQYDNGKIPCCVDRRGPDPVPEHDSHGQYIYSVHSCFVHTGDAEFLRRHYPRVKRAVEYIEFLRNQRMTEEFRSGPPEKRVLYGLMPESISHEGYSAKPMHSYWDDLWTLKGLSDAVRLAEAVNDAAGASRFAGLRDSFLQTMIDSIELARSIKSIDYIPGCAELGDFDATSTTVGLFPCGLIDALPQAALRNTFDRYWEFFTSRRDGKREWKDYTPYEHRTVGAMVLLGERDRAHEILDYFFRDQRPAGWRHWAEVVRADPREPWFIGDMPHTWVGSDFINSIVIMLAHTRERDAALVLGAGLPRAWLEAEDGVLVEGLRTDFGPLTYAARGVDARVRIEVTELPSRPPGGVWFSLPEAAAVRAVRLGGVQVPVPTDGLVRLPSTASVLEVEYAEGRP